MSNQYTQQLQLLNDKLDEQSQAAYQLSLECEALQVKLAHATEDN
jgi:hypothetical protein